MVSSIAYTRAATVSLPFPLCILDDINACAIVSKKKQVTILKRKKRWSDINQNI